MGIARWIFAAAGGLGAILTAGEAAAARCTVTNVTPINFGSYDISSSLPLETAGELAVECDAQTPVRISLGRGISGRQTPRELRSRASSLSYNLYLDPAHTVVWGDGTGATRAFEGLVPRGRALRIPIFARIEPRQQVPAGIYTDRIMIVVIF